jgi:hypothetical protein
MATPVRKLGLPLPKLKTATTALALALAFCIAIPLAAGAQTPAPSGTWNNLKKNTQGTWKRVKPKLEKYYEESPKLQATVEGVSSVIENGVLDKVPLGDAIGLVKDSPAYLKAGLTVWLQKKKNDAATAGDLDRADRYDAFLSCLYGDCGPLDTLRDRANGAKPPPPGQPYQIKINSAVVLVPQIQEGESTRLTVSVTTIVGGDVTLELQSSGEPIGPVRYVVKTQPGGSFSRDFNQIFPAAGNYRLLVLARDARSDTSARAYVVVAEKAKFDGHYTGTIELDGRVGDKRVTKPMALNFAVQDGKVTGTARFADKESNVVKIISTIDGSVDDKGNMTADLTYTHQVNEKGGAIYAFVITAPLTGTIKDAAVAGAFACGSKWTMNDAAKRQQDAPAPLFNGMPMMKEGALSKIAVVLMANSYKDAPGRFAAKRAK